MQDKNETEEQKTETIDLKKVYRELTKSSILRSKSNTKLLKKFVDLLANKPSFAHRVHKSFEILQCD